MKTLNIAFIILTIVVLGTSSVEAGKLKYASLKLDIAMVEQADGKILVGFKKKPTEAVKINIYDTQGYVVYTERISKGDVKLKRFDISQLPAGEYSFEVTNKVYAESKSFTK